MEEMELINYKNYHVQHCKQSKSRSRKGDNDSYDGQYHDPVNSDFQNNLGFDKKGKTKKSKFSIQAKKFFGLG